MAKPKIGIIGLGLIGGSLGLGLHASGHTVFGIEKNLSDLVGHPFASVTNDLNILSQCEVVFICTPILQVLPVLTAIQPFLQADTLISDVASVKTEICRQAAFIVRSDCIFIGGHPMAGTEQIGFRHANPSLFRDRPWCLVPSKDKRIVYLEGLISELGARLVFTDPAEHDEAVALISHLPLVLSIALKQTVEYHPRADLALKLASTGYGGMIRLASGNSELNGQILDSNHPEIKRALMSFLSQLDWVSAPKRDVDVS